MQCQNLPIQVRTGPGSRPTRPARLRRLRSRAAKRKKRQPFLPDGLGLERRMMPATFLVNTTADSGSSPLSLRQAILDSNATPGLNTIDFSIGAVGSQQTITPATPLPGIADPVFIDGWSQGGAGYTGVPLIVIDGTSAGAGSDGLDLDTGSDGSTIRGFVINDFTNAGISIATTDNTIDGCYIGTNDAGTAIGSPQLSYGVVVTAANNTIGGTSAGAGNLISGTTADGVYITGSGATGNLVAGNLIGTSADGETALGNRDDDIGIDDGATGNTIGGLTTKPGTGAGNLLSGSIFGNGINMQGGGGNLVEGNLIGTDLAGTTALSNMYDGIRLQSSSGDTIGGAAAGAGNIISGSGQFNLWLYGASDETIQGNYIGTDITGSFAVDTSTYAGIEILSSSGNLIGGTAPGAGNVVSGNSTGIAIDDYWSTNPDTTDGNIVEGNLVGLTAAGTAAVPNAGVGIDVGPSEDTQIGGTAAGAGNVVSGTQETSVPAGFDYPPGSNGVGILVAGPAPGVSIQDNLVGTNESGTAAIPNQGSGIFIQNTTATIGGNQVAGNGYDGITVQGSGAPNGLAGLWTADGTTFDGANDTEGTLLGGATYAPGISGQAFSFDGVSGAFEDSSVYTPPAGRILYPFGATMEMWINTTATSGTLITDGGGVDTQSGMGLFLQNGQLVATGSKGTAGQFNFELTSPMTVNDGQWHLVAVTWNGTTAADGVALYVDGVAVATGTALATIGNLGANDDGASSVLYFGGDPNLALPYYKGLIDEVGVYSAALSASDIATIYSVRGVAQAASAATITGNLIGTNAAGTAALPNGNDGIDLVGSSFNVIGGTTTGDLNVISGNTVAGVELNGADSTANVVAGNYIGTDITGTVAIANGTGVEIDTGASGNTIGGLTAKPGTGAGNLISGNATGIDDTGGGSDVIAGNLIGTNATGLAALGNTADGIDSDAPGDTIGGSTASARNVISGNAQFGIDLMAPSNAVEGNFIGTSITGITQIGNGVNGVVVTSGDETIGGPTSSPGSAPGNVISGNGDIGIQFYNDGTVGNTVQGNLIGLGADGSTALGNAVYGIYIANTSENITIGGAVAADRNVISANGDYGILTGAGATGLVIQGNFIGTDATGALPRGNAYVGIGIEAIGALIGGVTTSPGTAPGNLISANGDGPSSGGGIALINGGSATVEGNLVGVNAADTAALNNFQSSGVGVQSAGNTIGGTVAGAGNVLSGNARGVAISGAAATDNLVVGNFVGTNAAGTAAIANTAVGVQIYGSATGNTVGGTAAGARNLISGNTNDGVEIFGTGTSGNVVAGNFIGTDISGTLALPNSRGVEIDTSATGNTIGGLTATPGSGAGNLISGNLAAGIQIGTGSVDAATADNVVEGNLIGTDLTGENALPNLTYGVLAIGAGTTIGGHRGRGARCRLGECRGQYRDRGRHNRRPGRRELPGPRPDRHDDGWLHWGRPHRRIPGQHDRRHDGDGAKRDLGRLVDRNQPQLLQRHGQSDRGKLYRQRRQRHRRPDPTQSHRDLGTERVGGKHDRRDGRRRRQPGGGSGDRRPEHLLHDPDQQQPGRRKPHRFECDRDRRHRPDLWRHRLQRVG